MRGVYNLKFPGILGEPRFSSFFFAFPESNPAKCPAAPYGAARFPAPPSKIPSFRREMVSTPGASKYRAPLWRTRAREGGCLIRGVFIWSINGQFPIESLSTQGGRLVHRGRGSARVRRMQSEAGRGHQPLRQHRMCVSCADAVCTAAPALPPTAGLNQHRVVVSRDTRSWRRARRGHGVGTRNAHLVVAAAAGDPGPPRPYTCAAPSPRMSRRCPATFLPCHGDDYM